MNITTEQTKYLKIEMDNTNRPNEYEQKNVRVIPPRMTAQEEL